MVHMEDSTLKELLEVEKRQGILLGIRLMEERMLLACESGSPVAIKDHAYFVKSDLQHLREIMDKVEV